jgi:hypothetical protein
MSLFVIFIIYCRLDVSSTFLRMFSSRTSYYPLVGVNFCEIIPSPRREPAQPSANFSFGSADLAVPDHLIQTFPQLFLKFRREWTLVSSEEFRRAVICLSRVKPVARGHLCLSYGPERIP